MPAPIRILLEDDRMLVADKPVGLLSVAGRGSGGRSVPEHFAARGRTLLPVHRLDRDVSGALLFAKDEETRVRLVEAFRSEALVKTYWALLNGRPRRAEGAHHFPIAKEGSRARVSSTGQRAETRYRTLAELGAVTEVEIELVTGRYNQIRIHFAHAGTPLVGERKYAVGRQDPLRAGRLALHAWRLAFPHPWTGEPVAVEAPLPPALVRLRERAARGARPAAESPGRAPEPPLTGRKSFPETRGPA